MEITILGCGASVGVPSITCKCTVCTSDNPKNKRFRSSILLREGGYNILIDSSPDLRYQALNNSITRLNGVIYTHAHFDHCAGINEIVNFEPVSSDSFIPIYGDHITMGCLVPPSQYLFEKVNFSVQKRNYLMPNVIKRYEKFQIQNTNLSFILTEQQHGKIKSSGILIDNFAYCTDFNSMTDHSLELLQKANLELMVIQCLRYSSSLAHINFEQCMDWLEKIKPKRAFLTHMSHEIEYETIKKELEYYSKQLDIEILPAYDGLTVNV